VSNFWIQSFNAIFGQSRERMREMIINGHFCIGHTRTYWLDCNLHTRSSFTHTHTHPYTHTPLTHPYTHTPTHTHTHTYWASHIIHSFRRLQLWVDFHAYVFILYFSKILWEFLRHFELIGYFE
jgi:hypothetical protein